MTDAITDRGAEGDPHRELRELHEVYFARHDWDQPEVSAERPRYRSMIHKETRTQHGIREEVPVTDSPYAAPLFVSPDPAYLPRAVQWTGTNNDQVATLAAVVDHDDDTLVVQGYEGKCGLRRGHWVVSVPYDNITGSAVLVFSDEEFRKRWAL